MISSLTAREAGKHPHAERFKQAVQVFGTAGAGIVHAELLQKDPEYREWVKNQLEKHNWNSTLLFNEKKN